LSADSTRSALIVDARTSATNMDTIIRLRDFCRAEREWLLETVKR